MTPTFHTLIAALLLCHLHAFIEGIREAMFYHYASRTLRKDYPWKFDEHNMFVIQRLAFLGLLFIALMHHMHIISAAVMTAGLMLTWPITHDGILYTMRNVWNPLVYKKRFWASKETATEHDQVTTIEMSASFRVICAIIGLIICIISLHLKQL